MNNILMIFIVSVCTLSSQLLLKKGMMTIGTTVEGSSLARAVVSSPAILSGVVLQACGFILWLLILRKTNLGYAFGFSGAFFYILLPLLTWWLYGERLTNLQWVGMGLLCISVMCLASKS